MVLVCALTAPQGEIAFTAGTEQENQRIHIVDVATGEARAVGQGNRDGAPVWSPDGQWLAYPSAQEGGMGIRMMKGDGTGDRTLVNQHRWNHSPRWSPDSRYLCYSSDDRMGLERRLVVYDREADQEEIWGGELNRMVVRAPLVGLLQPLWLAEPKLVAMLDPEMEINLAGVDMDLLREEGGLLDLSVILGTMPHALLATGLFGVPGKYSTEPVLVTKTQVVPILPLLPNAPESGRYMEWGLAMNRKGDKVVFESNDGGDREIYLLGSRGLSNISNHRAADWNPVWGQGSQEILFESFRHGRRGIYKVIADTGRVTPLVISKAYDTWAPAWSPDDQWVAYVSNETGRAGIYVCSAKGEDVQVVVAGDGMHYAPAWRPEVEK